MHICSNWPEGEKNNRSDTDYNWMSAGDESGESFLINGRVAFLRAVRRGCKLESVLANRDKEVGKHAVSGS